MKRAISPSTLRSPLASDRSSELDDPTSAVSGRGVEFNEKSLGLRYRDLGGGDRVEVYNRFLQRPRNFLSYGELRLWAVAREGSQGLEAPTDFFVKVGSDPDNYYLYRARLEPAPSASAASTVPAGFMCGLRLLGRETSWSGFPGCKARATPSLGVVLLRP